MITNKAETSSQDSDLPNPLTIVEIVAKKIEQSESARGLLTFFAACAGVKIGLHQLAHKLDQDNHALLDQTLLKPETLLINYSHPMQLLFAQHKVLTQHASPVNDIS